MNGNCVHLNDSADSIEADLVYTMYKLHMKNSLVLNLLMTVNSLSDS